ncbi:response regulator transcription factor [Anaerocolumna chitinilytica]|jgi:DNA-binding response OmpR family regulator|uniref:Stage 0 sporulation protein A homolog n=1 Tax=Anaerocolumna chitinilytica TaxID=1727145 RepID=A0A7I8DLE7_9FIRM|nr:response regulator transcription factor [Anaerocolumna chitinilytica]BCJ99132.1 DNA-binding response regulator [Anaerocolumna chitinilytica]
MEQLLTVLIVEDSLEIVELIKLYLENERFNILIAGDGRRALQYVTEEKVDLIILDIMIPIINGYEVLKKVREKHNLPIIILSSKNMDNDIILGLNLGADDYVTKPFNPLELMARVKAQLRRFHKLGAGEITEEEPDITVKELMLKCRECQLLKRGNYIDLTYMEYRLLKFLMSDPGRVYTKKQLFTHVWEEDVLYSENTIMVYISKLRDKVEDNPKEPKYIKTVRGLGYKFEENQN